MQTRLPHHIVSRSDGRKGLRKQWPWVSLKKMREPAVDQPRSNHYILDGILLSWYVRLNSPTNSRLVRRHPQRLRAEEHSSGCGDVRGDGTSSCPSPQLWHQGIPVHPHARVENSA